MCVCVCVCVCFFLYFRVVLLLGCMQRYSALNCKWAVITVSKRFDFNYASPAAGKRLLLLVVDLLALITVCFTLPCA